MRAWTPEQPRRFLDHVAGDRLFAAWLLAATTGMRCGEVLGLRWVDGDPDAKRLAVRQTLVMVKGAAPCCSEPKTRRSRRTVDLDDVTFRALQDWRESQDQDREAWGAAWKNLGLVFTREDGAAIYPDGWTGTFERHVRQAGLPHIRLHDLRHTHATLMLKGGVNPKVVSERLGHHSAASRSTCTPTWCPACRQRPPRGCPSWSSRPPSRKAVAPRGHREAQCVSDR